MWDSESLMTATEACLHISTGRVIKLDQLQPLVCLPLITVLCAGQGDNSCRGSLEEFLLRTSSTFDLLIKVRQGNFICETQFQQGNTRYMTYQNV